MTLTVVRVMLGCSLHAATGKGIPLFAECAARGIYPTRKPQQTPLYRLVEAHYEEVKGVWEERFEQRNGFWRGFVDGVVERYLDCGRYEAGLARVRCPGCAGEFLVACSCKGRGFCPSCGAKRAAVFAAFLRDEVLEQVAHAQWVLTVPRMIRPYFLHHRELLGKLCRAAYETVQELMLDSHLLCPGLGVPPPEHPRAVFRAAHKV